MNRPAQHAKSRRPRPALLNGKLYETSSVKEGGLLLAAEEPRPVASPREGASARLPSPRWRTCRGRAEEAAARLRIVVIVEEALRWLLGLRGAGSHAARLAALATGGKEAAAAAAAAAALATGGKEAAAAAALATGGKEAAALRPTAAAAVAAE